MKHLIETEDLNGLGNVKYDRLILDSTKNEIIYRGGVINANGHSYVDLGLPSGLKWAKCNVGAASETEYGDYFMWGSTKPNTADEFSWANAPFNGGAETFDEDYFTAHKSEWLDDNDNLKLEYDAARVNMGGDWRMPTKDDFDELLRNTKLKFLNGGGYYGLKCTSKTDETKYIFISAGKNYDDGYFWSSSLNDSDPRNAWCLWFSQIQIDINNYIRTSSYPVRGVL